MLSIPEQAANFFEGVELDDPEPIIRALRSQSFDFVTALLDLLEESTWLEEYIPFHHPLLCTLVGEFGWKKRARYFVQDPDFPGQGYRLQRPSEERENRSRRLAAQTQNEHRETPTKAMAAATQQAMEFLTANQDNDIMIIHALQTGADNFVEASFDIIEKETRTAWVSPRRPLIRYLVDEVGWLKGPNTGTTAPWAQMIRPAHHTTQKTDGGIWVPATWRLRARARRAWMTDEIKTGESYQSWYQARFRAQRARARKRRAQEAETHGKPTRDGFERLKRSVCREPRVCQTRLVELGHSEMKGTVLPPTMVHNTSRDISEKRPRTPTRM